MPSRKADPVYTPLLATTQSAPSSERMSAPFSQRAIANGNEVDSVQFASATFYAREAEGKASIQVIRIGSLNGACSVQFETTDASAIAGHKYKYLKGTAEFAPGEYSRRFEVEIINDDAFDTTIEFKVELGNCKNCAVEPGFGICRVMISDDDMFPSNEFQKEIESGDDTQLHAVGFKLLFAFMRFTFSHVPTIAWKSIIMILLAQLGNAYYLMTIYLKVYLVDVCLNTEEPESKDQLFIPGNRKMTAVVLGLAFILPNVILTGSDYFEMTVLEMGFNIRKHLRVNLFRKYLNYTPESRAEVPIQDLKTSMMEDIPDVVANGYLILFELWRIFGKIACVAFFMLKKHPRSAVPLFVYPALMILWLSCRYKTRMKLLSKTGDGESDTQGWLIHADSAHRLITDYKQRGFVVDKFEEVLVEQRRLTMDAKSFNFWNELLVPWITILAVGCYMAIWSAEVIDGKLSMGSFLATINVYNDLGDRFEGLYGCFTSMTEAIEPLAGLTGQFNLATDVEDAMARSQAREDWVSEMLRGKPVTGTVPLYDTVPIALQQVSVPHSPSLKTPGGITVQAPQGNIVLIRGPHDSGKSTIISLLTDNLSAPSGKDVELPTGKVLYPLHLRVLHVSYAPVIVSNFGLYRNLTFGKDELDPHDFDRVRRVLVRLGLDKQWILEELEKSIAIEQRVKLPKKATSNFSFPVELKTLSKGASDDEADSEEASEEDEEEEEEDGGSSEEWINRLSNSERKRIHLARAFIFNPEVLVLHRPVDEFELDLTDKILGLMREFVDNRGVELDASTAHRRRPRTVFFTGGTIKKPRIVDLIWHVGAQGAGIQVERGEGGHVP